MASSPDAVDAYEANAIEFLRGRDPSPIGTMIIADWCQTLPPSATVIELACGGGYPITKALCAAGLKVSAVEGSPSLATTFSARFPEIELQCARVQRSDFFGRTFDAAVAVGLLFLLPASDQHILIAKVHRHLVPGGKFLFMAPVQPGRWKDLNTGLECHSLGKAEYEACFAASGFRLVRTYVDRGDNHYYDVARLIEPIDQ